MVMVPSGMMIAATSGIKFSVSAKVNPLML
jgi:hypothetical protein